MNKEYNIYCDESCHLEYDHSPVMLMSAVWCSQEKVKDLSNEIYKIKEKFNAHGEIKWNKVSKSKESFYNAIVEWFFKNDDMHFRCLVVTNKSVLNHDRFNIGSHDEFYYKMYFSMLNKILSPDRSYNIYLDIKDTRSNLKLRKLREYLCHDKYDFTYQMINNIQNIRSHESPLMQISDFLMGAISYKWRELGSNSTKLNIIRKIENMSDKNFKYSTSLYEKKFNLFIFSPQKT